MPNRTIPLDILKLRGTARSDRHGNRGIEGKPTSRAPPAPNWLPANAKLIWRKVSKEMVKAETWQPIFESTLAAYCVLYAGFKADPMGFTASKLTQMRLLGADMGLSPSTAGKVEKAPIPKKNPFADF